MTWRERCLYFLYLHRTGLTVCALTLVLVLYPPLWGNPYRLGVTNQIALYAIVVLGLNLFIGYAGQISLGHAAFFALGAYGSALLSGEAGVNPWLALTLAVLAAALLALLVGIPTLRLHGHYLAMATLGFNLVVYLVLLQWDKLTGGPSGYAGIRPLAIGTFVFASDLRLHYLVWGVALLCLTLALNLVRSGVGRGLAAVAGDEVAAAACGVDTRAAKVKVFVLSAAFAALAGGLYAHGFGFVGPETFSIFASVDFVTMVVIGGLGSVWGSLFGAALLTWLPEWIDRFENCKEIVHGVILVGVLIFLPQGLVTGLIDLVRVKLVRWKARHA
jgi:branched-chain amino acid transport system permease protein